MGRRALPASALLALLAASGCSASAKAPPAPAARAEAPRSLSHAAREAYLQAHVAWARGDLVEAEGRLRRAVFFDPRGAALHRDLGRVLLAQGRLSDGRSELERALVLDPTDLRCVAELGRAHYLQGDPERAAQLLERALVGLDDPDLEALLEAARAGGDP